VLPSTKEAPRALAKSPVHPCTQLSLRLRPQRRGARHTSPLGDGESGAPPPETLIADMSTGFVSESDKTRSDNDNLHEGEVFQHLVHHFGHCLKGAGRMCLL
jgi:hypothetical protein